MANLEQPTVSGSSLQATLIRCIEYSKGRGEPLVQESFTEDSQQTQLLTTNFYLTCLLTNCYLVSGNRTRTFRLKERMNEWDVTQIGELQ